MDNIILKASKGNRNQVYYVANGLLRGSPSAIEAAKWAIISSLQSLSRGMIRTEKEFADYAIVQVVNYCKKDITKKDSHAFRVPPKKNFRITSVDENVIKSAKRPCEYYFNSLPASQRFVFVLRLIGGMNEEQISDEIDVCLCVFVHTASLRNNISYVFVILLQACFLVRNIRITIEYLCAVCSGFGLLNIPRIFEF